MSDHTPSTAAVPIRFKRLRTGERGVGKQVHWKVFHKESGALVGEYPTLRVYATEKNISYAGLRNYVSDQKHAPKAARYTDFRFERMWHNTVVPVCDMLA